jgi:hypothetical protein
MMEKGNRDSRRRRGQLSAHRRARECSGRAKCGKVAGRRCLVSGRRMTDDGWPMASSVRLDAGVWGSRELLLQDNLGRELGMAGFLGT